MRLHFETKQLQAFVLLAGWSESTRLGLIARLRRGGVAAALISCDLLGARADTPYRVQIRRKCKYVNEIRLAPGPHQGSANRLTATAPALPDPSRCGLRLSVLLLSL